MTDDVPAVPTQFDELLSFGRGPAYSVGVISMRKAKEAEKLNQQAGQLYADALELAEAARIMAKAEGTTHE